MSLPMPMAANSAAIAAPVPPLEPPGTLSGSYGSKRSAWVAKLLASIRERANQHSILYDGHYARRTRKHTRKKRPAANYDELNATQRKTLRRRWANLIRRVFKTDPLICKNCGGKMRVVSFMSEPSVICQILDHLENRNSRDPPLSSATLPRA